jgi:outer membrane protein TolC
MTLFGAIGLAAVLAVPLRAHPEAGPRDASAPGAERGSPSPRPSPPLRGGEGGLLLTSTWTSTPSASPAVRPERSADAEASARSRGAPTEPEPTTDPEIPLTDALARLDHQSLTLVQSRSRAAEASAITRQSASALLPTLTAQGSYVRNSDEAAVVRPGGPTLFIQPLEQRTATGALRVPLIVPNAWFELAQSRDAARAADASAAATRLQVRTGFAQAAFASAAGEEIVAASARAATSAAELVRSAQRRVQAGTAAPLDVLKAEAEEVRRESDLARARADLARSRLALGILLGEERPVRVQVPAEPPVAPDAPPDALARDALVRRPELAAQRAQVDAAEAGVRSAWARLAPQLSASGSIFASDVAYPTGETEAWRASVDLVWPLYDGGLRYGKRRQAEAQLEGARAAAEAQRLAVIQEVLDGRRDLDVARERLRLAEAQRRLAADAAASARRSFDAGVASSLDVIDANDRLYQADVGLAESRARLAQSGLALERALGRDP